MSAIRGMIAGASLTGAALWTPAAIAQGPPPAAVRVDSVKQESVQERHLVTGDLRAMRRSHVASREDGVITELPLGEGALVAQGDLLARLDNTRMQLEVNAMQAERSSAESMLQERHANLAQAKREVDLLERTLALEAARQKEVDDARSDLQVAEARVSQAERDISLIDARLELVRERLADMEIRAPFTGVIVSIETELGEWIGEGDPVIELLAIDRLEAWLAVPQRLLGPVQNTSDLVVVTLDATDDEIEVESQRHIPQVDERARTFTLIATLDNADALLAPGMSITAWVPAGERGEALTIPKDAVMRSDLGSYVYVVREGGPQQPPMAVPANVVVRFPLGDRVVVSSGDLQSGDMVVVEGNERLYPAAPVSPTAREVQASADETVNPTVNAYGAQPSAVAGADRP